MTDGTMGQRMPGRRADRRAGAMRPGWGALALAAAMAWAVPVDARAQTNNGPATVSTFGFIYGYEGPLGGVIREDGSVDTSVQSWFRDVTTGRQEAFGPLDPYPGYEAATFSGTGTGYVDLFRQLPGATLSQGVQFWTQFGATPPMPGDVNQLRIQGHVTNGVTINPATGTSGDIKIATISFTNSSWYPTTPGYDAGNGLLAPTSTFAFEVGASANPSIGTPTLPASQLHMFYGNLVLTTTMGSDPDYLQLFDSRGQPSFASSVLSVPEGVTGTVELWGRIGSLIPTYFDNPSGGVQILSSIPITPVPEPATVALMLAGLAVVGGAARRRERTDRSGMAAAA